MILRTIGLVLVLGATAAANPPIPDPIHAVHPTRFEKLTVDKELVFHGYSDCHLGAGIEATCSGNIEGELLASDRGPVVSAVSSRDVAIREPKHVKLLRGALCHDFYARLRSSGPVTCDVTVHAVIYPD